LLAAHRDWGDTYGQVLPSNDSGAAIITGPDRDTSHLEFRFRAPIAIHGKVVDQNGDPIPSATVELFLQSVVAGKRRLRSLGSAESDDFGQFSWSSLNAGTYYLAAAGEPWCLSDEFARIQLIEGGTLALAPPYALSYFPGTDDASAAVPLVLRPGADVQADFTLHTASGTILRFACSNADSCGGSVSLYAMGPGDTQALVRTADVRGTADIQSVRPGRYTIRYTGDDGASARRLIDVPNGEVTVDLEPKAAPTLSGKVSFQNPKDHPRHTVYVSLMDEATGKPDTVVLGPDGVFSWPVVAASHGRLFLSGDDGFFIAHMSVDGANVKDGAIDFVDGATVRVELSVSNETGTLKGFVKKENGEPAPSVLVVLVPIAAPTGAQPQMFQTDSDGSFDCPQVPAGDYAVFAVDNPELEYAVPEAIRPYLPVAKHVRIEPHSTRTADIDLSPAVHK
jgi:hypothetical protein